MTVKKFNREKDADYIIHYVMMNFYRQQKQMYNSMLQHDYITKRKNFVLQQKHRTVTEHMICFYSDIEKKQKVFLLFHINYIKKKY